MDTGTYYLTQHEVKIIEVMRDILKHGYGEFTICTQETRDFKSKIMIKAGRSWIFFVDKDITTFDEL